MTSLVRRYGHTLKLGAIASSFILLSFMQKMETIPFGGPLTLSGDSPEGHVPFNRSAAEKRPSAIQVTVDSITAAGGGAYVIKAYIGKTGNRNESLFIGSFTPYPKTRPGSFLLGLNAYKEKTLSGMLELVLQQDAAQTAPRTTLRIHIRSIAWVVEKSADQ